MKPGVVTGSDYKELVAACKAGKYALPAVNISGTNTINAVLEAAAAAKSDVIIQMSNGGAGFLAGKGMANSHDAMVMGAVAGAQHVHLLAEHYGVCVVLHTDHANRKLVPWIDSLIEQNAKFHAANGKPLFSSHMLDLSEEPIVDNIDTCVEYLKKLDALSISLEIELGVTGGEEDGVGSDDLSDQSKLYTTPEDVWYAYEKLEGLGHFSVAAAFGNVHGVYKPGNVTLQPKILKDCQDHVETKLSNGEKNPCDFVFHGGSGSDESDIKEAIGYGVFKMNIDTDTQFAFSSGIYSYMKKTPNAFEHQIDPETGKPSKSIYDPRKVLRAGEENMAERLQEAFEVLGSKGNAIANA
ncbi:MAG: class II fructose-bisphosphate aldolase [Pseudomonadota bacterium]